MVRKKLVNELSWSHSRGKALGTCARKVWFGQFGSWEGWSPLASRRQRRTYWLKKNVEGRYAWAGKVVHRAAEEMLGSIRCGDALDSKVAGDRCVRRMRDDFIRSRSGASGFRLMEHLYEDDVSDEQWVSLADRVRLSVRTLYDLPFVERLREACPDRWVSVEELEHFKVGGVKVWLSIDFAWRPEEDLYEVVDWKTGKASDADRDQARLYNVFLARKFGVPVSRVRSRMVYLLTGKYAVHDGSEDDVSAVQARVAGDVAEFRKMGLVEGPDGHCTAPEEKWWTARDDRECGFCAFREVCDRD